MLLKDFYHEVSHLNLFYKNLYYYKIKQIALH